MTEVTSVLAHNKIKIKDFLNLSLNIIINKVTGLRLQTII